MSAPHPFASLVGPLRYACARGFAQLSTVKDLGALLRGAIDAAEKSGLEPSAIDALRAELPHVDSAAPERRKASLLRVLAAVRAGGLSLPPELSALVAQGGEHEGPSNGPPGENEPGLPDEGGGAPEPESDERPEPVDQARLLSIAPREGPLATPLKQAGWRINPRLLGQLNRKGMSKVGDVLFLLPRVYEDRRRMRLIAQLSPGERGVTVGEVRTAGEVPLRRGRRCFRAVIADKSGSIAATFFQTGPWLKAKFPVGKRVVISGEVRASGYGREMAHPEVEPADDQATSSIHFGRIVPVYPGFERHEQRAFRELTFRVAEKFASSIEEPLPQWLRKKLSLLELGEALRRIHFPREEDEIARLDAHQSAAHRRLAFDELFFLQLGLSLRRQGVKLQPGIAFDASEARLSRARSMLPFQLTEAQARAVRQICRDMASPEPMNRLLQGDVGSGKTAVAAVAAAVALFDGYQVALMAPTEILAEQHHHTLRGYLGALGFEVGLVTAAGTPRARKEVREAICAGRLPVAVGTHALIQEGVELHRLGLVIIDEQHRFGVIQRHALMSKGRRPDVLVMTATPIPRTLAMTVYGDLEVSLIDELPPGRTPIVTRVYVEKARERVYERMREELERGHQCYVVYPLVEESEKVDLADATRGAQELARLFPDRKVGLLHGRLRQEEKEQVMAEFRARRTEIMVCTTVVEVGVDVPNASVMVIEGAERFGLSQLHQLRGRVGRGAAASYCYLIAGYARSKESSDRLRVMEESNDGFVIAEKDLELRGPGEFLGTRQSGIPELAVANLVRDQPLLNLARDEARSIVERDPRLRLPEHLGLVKALEERWEGRLALARVG
ncbi:MAG: ATP-dependent DNA helicase RecG [Myxococcales bacterium]|nr:ATP-dependent DNA helicase RecG [Myxococcales bacterium]